MTTEVGEHMQKWGLPEGVKGAHTTTEVMESFQK